jgi:large subunit ribosomal protein L24
MSIKVGDNVQIIAGKDKGKKGKVIRVLRKQDRVVVDGANIMKKHIKKTQERAGERIETEAPLHVSNVQIICPSCKKLTRVGIQESKNGKRMRVCKKCSESLERKFVKS